MSKDAPLSLQQQPEQHAGHQALGRDSLSVSYEQEGEASRPQIAGRDSCNASPKQYHNFDTNNPKAWASVYPESCMQSAAPAPEHTMEEDGNRIPSTHVRVEAPLLNPLIFLALSPRGK